MAKDISPEERLLSLIKKKPRKEPGAHAPETDAKAQSGTPSPKGGVHISGILKSDLFRSKLLEPSSLKNINRYLVAILGILIFYFLIDLIFVRPYKNVQQLISKAETEYKGKAMPAEAKNSGYVKDYSSYSSGVSGRTVFGPSQGGPAPSENVAGAGDISERIGLVGIIAGDNPQAIIEDKKAQKTYYMSKGQSFDGYVVEEIYDDKVIINYEGRKISLFL